MLPLIGRERDSKGRSNRGTPLSRLMCFLFVSEVDNQDGGRCSLSIFGPRACKDYCCAKNIVFGDAVHRESSGRSGRQQR